MSLYESLNEGSGRNVAFNALPALAWARANGMNVHALALVHLGWLSNATVESTTTVRGESEAKKKAEAAGLIAPGLSTGDALRRTIRELTSAGMPTHLGDPWVEHYRLGAVESGSEPASSARVTPHTFVGESHGVESNADAGPASSLTAMGTYKDALDDRFVALKAAINATNTPYGKRPVAQLLGHLRWSRPNQTVHWNAGTTPSVPETAAGLSIDVGTPLPDALEVVFAALRSELPGEVLASLDAYHHAVHDLNARYGVAPSINPANVALGVHESGSGDIERTDVIVGDTDDAHPSVDHGATVEVPPAVHGLVQRVEEHRVRLVSPEACNVTEYKTTPVGGERARRTESVLVKSFEEWLIAQGRDVRRAQIRPRGESIELVTDTYDVTQGVLYEAKSSTDRATIRLGVGQLLDYLRHLPDVQGSLLLPSDPSYDLREFIHSCGLWVTYPQGESWVTETTNREEATG